MAGSTTKIADSSFIRSLTNNSYIGGSASYCPTYSEIQTNEPNLNIASGYSSTRLVVEDDILRFNMLNNTNTYYESKVNFTDGSLNIAQSQYGFNITVWFGVREIITTSTANLVFSIYQSNTLDILGARFEQTSSGSTQLYRVGMFIKDSSGTNNYQYSSSWSPSRLAGQWFVYTASKSPGSDTIKVFLGKADSQSSTYNYSANFTFNPPTGKLWRSANCTYFYVGDHPQYSGMTSAITVNKLTVSKTF